nr:restriction endonuclease subunit S [Pseudoalteromonas sp. TB13]
MTFKPRFVTLSEVTTLRNGAGIKQENFTEKSNGIPLVKVSNFTQNSIDMNGLTMVNFDHAQKWSSHIIQKGNVLIATVGSWPPNWSSVVGKVVRAPENSSGSIQNQNTCCLIPTDELDEGYLYYKLKDSKFLEWVVNIAQGSANQARVPIKKLGEYCFELPSIAAQKYISSTLEALDNKITVNFQTNQTLEEMAQAIFKSWFIDFDPVKAKMRGEQPEGMDATTAALFPNKLVESELGLVPEGWDVKSFSDWVKITKGKNITKKTIVEGDVPVVAGGLKPAYFHNTHNVEGPAITISASGANAGFVNLYFQNIWASDCSFISESTTSFFYLQYVFLVFNQKNIFGMQTGAAQPHIYPRDFERLMVVIPNEDLCTKVENTFASLFRKIANNKYQNIELSQLRDTLLPKLLSGEIELTKEELTDES